MGDERYLQHFLRDRLTPTRDMKVTALVLGLEGLYRVSGRSADRALSLAWADWLAGHNVARTVLYDPETGRCSDGLVGDRPSSNCGAESAIEAQAHAGGPRPYVPIATATGCHGGANRRRLASLTR